MIYIDMENWARREHFNFFKGMDYPQFNICANVDVTELYKAIKVHGYSFYNTMIYLTSRVANNIDEFKYRIRDNKVILHEYVRPSFTILTTEDAFSFCTVEYNENFIGFYKSAEAKIKSLEEKINLTDELGKDDLLYITCIPWVSFTGITHTIHLNPSDSVPRISWGKFFEENGRYKLPFSIQANHALMDGLHVGKYYNRLQTLLDQPESYLQHV